MRSISNSLGVNKLSKYLSGTKLGQRLSSLEDWQVQGRNELDWLKENNIQFVRYCDMEYPQSFRRLCFPPLGLTVYGSTKNLNADCLSVVGSRNPNLYSRQWLQESLKIFVNEVDVVIASGGAYGIDQLAHNICLRLKRPTICFLPSGFRRLYPCSLAKIMTEFETQGSTVVSQFSPFQDLYKGQFCARNELMAILGGATFVVEAGLKSGTMLTAKHAISHDREVWTLPCHPASGSGKGNLELLYSGATLIRDFNDMKLAWSMLSCGFS